MQGSFDFGSSAVWFEWGCSQVTDLIRRTNLGCPHALGINAFSALVFNSGGANGDRSAVPFGDLGWVFGGYPGLTSGAIVCRPCGTGRVRRSFRLQRLAAVPETCAGGISRSRRNCVLARQRPKAC